MHNSIMKVSNTKNSSFGTGFIIDTNDDGIFIITCGHVVNGVEKNLLVDNVSANLIINTYSEDLDLALLFVKNLSGKKLDIELEKESNNGYVIGYTKLMDSAKKESITDIRIKNNIEIDKLTRKINAIKLYPNESINAGYSGSPVICSKTHKVIGVVNIQIGSEINYAISTRHIENIYDKNKLVNDASTPSVTNKIRLPDEVLETHGEYIEKVLSDRVEKALHCYSSQINQWQEPKLYYSDELVNRKENIEKYTNVNSLIKNPTSTIINARQQFGLSSLAHYLVLQAIQQETPSFWLYLDYHQLKPYEREINKYIIKTLKPFSLSIEHVECIVLDELSCEDENALKIVSLIDEMFKDRPVIIMMTNNGQQECTIDNIRKFKKLYLWSLSRNEIRTLVNNYNNNKFVSNDNAIVTKITSDLEVLNIPRTVLNCLTFLKIYEAEFDESPVNRTGMIYRVMFLLFNVDDIPNYKTRPDLTDCEHILGFLCKNMIIRDEFSFSRKSFLTELNDFCTDNEIEVEVDVIFDVLFNNNIIIEKNELFCFKFTYWVLYFAAHEMHNDEEFYQHVFNDMNYIDFPEIVEFYTGIDRKSDKALQKLTADIKATRELVKKQCNIPENFDIYALLKWNPSPETIKEIEKELALSVGSSGLPDEVKDQYADESYDCTKPLTQDVNKILEEYSLLRLMRSLQAGCKALRNNDYSKPAIRHQLLNEILQSWEQVIKVLLTLAPVIADKGSVSLEGANFIFEFSGIPTFEEKFNAVICALPEGTVSWFRDDIFSSKMGPLLYNNAKEKENKLALHTLSILIVQKRPKNWKENISQYILSLDKNSYYLADISRILSDEYSYSFASEKDANSLVELLKLTFAKHQLGITKINQKKINRLNFDSLPARDVDIDDY